MRTGIPIQARQDVRAPGTPPMTARLSFLIIDDHQPFVTALANSLADVATVQGCNTFAAAREIISARGRPSYIVSESKVRGLDLLSFLRSDTASIDIAHLIVVTAYPSVARAVHFTRMGVAGYLTKPAVAVDLFDVIGVRRDSAGESTRPPESPTWPTLDRTIWEYICRVHEAAGSMSEAARRLGVDRRSLRRMLAKYPPPR